ncbi:hypothetical protein ACFQX6_09545 [Streptosporangium lutulentum]
MGEARYPVTHGRDLKRRFRVLGRAPNETAIRSIGRPRGLPSAWIAEAIGTPAGTNPRRGVHAGYLWA